MKKVFGLMLALAIGGAVAAQTATPAEKKEEKAATKKEAKPASGVKEEKKADKAEAKPAGEKKAEMKKEDHEKKAEPKN